MQLRRLAARVNGHDRDPFARVRVLHRIDAVQYLELATDERHRHAERFGNALGELVDALASMCIPAPFHRAGIAGRPYISKC